MTTFDKHDDLPYDTHCHLLALEVWIGGLDGADITHWNEGEDGKTSGIDEGTIDAEDAVKAVNAMIAAIRYMTAQRDSEREARNKLDAALRQKDDAMSVLFGRLKTAGVDYSDLIS